jgi:hypothetical protein
MNISKDNVLGFSVIDNRLKLFVKQGTVSQNQSQNQQTQDSNTPDIRKAEGEVKYYKNLDEDLNKTEETNSSDKKAFFQIWKQGDN